MVRHLLGTAAAVTLLTGPAFAQDTTEDTAANGAMTVQQCAPAVTVTQTPPKVTVTVSEDAEADPMVTVTQSPPEVTVENCAPTITGADGEQIEAEVTEAEADVTINAAENAELTVTRMGAAEDPATDEAATDDPAAEEPATQEATAEEPQADEAAQEEPAAEEPAAAEPAPAEEGDPKDQMGEAPEGEAASEEAEAAPEGEVAPASEDMAAPMTEAEDGPEAATAPEEATAPTEAMPESDPQAPEPEADDAAAQDTADEAAADAATTEVAPSAGEVTASANAIALREGSSLVEADEVMAEGMDGTPVYSSDDEEVGSIEMFDTDTEAAIIGVGGFLGLGEKNVALPLSDLSFQRGGEGELRAYIATASDQIEALPEHEGSE